MTSPWRTRAIALALAAAIYLLDRDGRYLGIYPPGTRAERLAGLLREELAPR